MNPQENPPTDNGVTPTPNPTPDPAPPSTPTPPPAAPSGPQVIGPQQSQPISGQPTPPPVSDPLPQPSATLPSQPQAFSSGVEPLGAPKKKRPGKKILIALAIGLFFGLGGGAFAYWQVLNNSPEKVLADALSSTMKDVLDRKPIQLTGVVTYESTGITPYTVAVDMDSKQVNGNGEATVKVNVKMDKVDVTVDAAFVTESTKAFYFKINDLEKTVDNVVAALGGDNSGLPEQYKQIITKIDGTWIKFDEKILADMGMAQEGEINECITAVEELRISDDDKSNIRDIFKSNQFATVTQEFADEDVNGDKSFHYKLDMNDEATLHFVKEFVELESFRSVKEACEIEGSDIDKAIEQLKETTDKEVDTDSKPVFELWVSKKTRYPTKAKISFKDRQVTMESITTIKINASDIAVNIPTEFTTIQELQKDFQELSASRQSLAAPGQSLGWSDIREEIIQN